ncbi:MAG: hypothetical protein E7273_14150 [Pseudobutyrivibrio ruminis]|nr:hypothetical protein [Pseudobutyrivibrio ruminis]
MIILWYGAYSSWEKIIIRCWKAIIAICPIKCKMTIFSDIIEMILGKEDIAYVQYLKIPSRGGGLISNPGLS